MIFLRSLLFQILLLLVTPVYGFLALPIAALLPIHARYRLFASWAAFVTHAARIVLGIRYQVIGRENLPAQPAVLLAKHQSAWETCAFQTIFPPQGYVLKRELLLIPFFGWGLALTPVIAINRKAGRDALKQVAEQGKKRLAQGFWVVIFPEGTRVAPGQKGNYKGGGALLASASKAPVVPVAHNAGEFWPKNSFLKKPGLITVSIGPAIDASAHSASEITAQAEAWIEGEMHRLFPHHYAGGESECPAD